jgi:hypothetical protein
VLALAAQLFAGGFWLVLGNPEASAEARSINAVLTVKSAGCMPVANTSFSARAVGVVNGRRQSIPLKLAALAEPGMFALTRQWPAEGKWVLEIVGTNQTLVATALVAAGPDGVDRLNAKIVAGPPPPAATENLLSARK